MLVSMDPDFDRIIAPGTRLETIVTIPDVNGEGPVWRKDRLWFSDQKGGGIYEVSPDGTYREVLAEAGGPVDPSKNYNQGPNGEAQYKNGALLFCRQGLRDIGIMDKGGKVSPFLADYQGKRFNSPNDIVISHDGAVWFTDPPFSLPGFRQMKPGDPPPASKEIPFNGVFRFKDGKLNPVITDMNLPNGLGLSPDGKTFYVDNTSPEMVVRAYDVGPDGALSNMRIFTRFAPDNPLGRGAPDGLKVDSAGNVWMTGPGGIIILSPQGKILGRLQLPSSATNMAFGEDYKSLFITSGPNIYRIRTLVKGQIPTFADR